MFGQVFVKPFQLPDFHLAARGGIWISTNVHAAGEYVFELGSIFVGTDLFYMNAKKSAKMAFNH